MQLVLLKIDDLLARVRYNPFISGLFSASDLLDGRIAEDQRAAIAKDLNTIAYWREIYIGFHGDEERQLENPDMLIWVFEPPISGVVVADGFHRLTAAKLAKLDRIGAIIAKSFPRQR